MPITVMQIGEYTVSEAGPLHAARAVNFSAQYNEMLRQLHERGNEVTEDELERAQALSIWMTVGAVVDPRVSMDTWLTIPITQIAEMRTAAMQLNPSWFETDTPEAQKKSVSKRKRTMTG